MAQIRDYRGYRIEKKWCPKLRYVVSSLNYSSGKLKEVHRYIDRKEDKNDLLFSYLS